MPKSSGTSPTILSIAKRSSPTKDENNNDDSAFLLPSNSSSFNLADDTEVINSSRTHRKGGKNTARKSKHKHQNSRDSTSSIGSGSRSSEQAPIADRNFYVNDQCKSQTEGEISLRSASFARSNIRYGIVASEKTYMHQDDTSSVGRSHGSNRSGKSMKRRMKSKRVEKRRKWMTRHRRKKICGAICLTIVYSLLFFYTMIITIGPLALHHLIDITEWCPYYYNESWEGNAHDAYFLDLDQTNIVRDDTIKAMNIKLLQRTSNDIHQHKRDDLDVGPTKYDNPDYNHSPCHITRIPSLFYLTLEECDLSRRMVASIIFGGFIGFERRTSDRPAGIRTMALVALGSCFFTLSSQLAFRDSPMTWDSSRVSAAIPSGVGFLGAGLIWKGSLSDGEGGEVHQVHGITTAASVWLAAAVGVGAGGALYAVTAYSTALITIVLRFGPRLYFQNDRGFEDDADSAEEEDSESSKCRTNQKGENVALQRELTNLNISSVELNDMRNRYGATDAEIGLDLETVTLLGKENRNSVDNRADKTTQRKVSLCKENKFLSWLIKLVPSKAQTRPLNPYQEYENDKHIKRYIMKKKSMQKSKSGVNFCT